MAVTVKMKKLLERVKANLILQHNADDELLLGFIAAAVGYAESYQKHKYGRGKMPPSTEQAVIMLAGHFYESRTGGTGGFFNDTSAAANTALEAVHLLLGVDKEWWHL